MSYNFTAIDANDLQTLARRVNEELLNIQERQDQVTSLIFSPLAVEPKKRFDGLVVYADGTNWNPGSGKGIYRYNGAAWVFLG